MFKLFSHGIGHHESDGGKRFAAKLPGFFRYFHTSCGSAGEKSFCNKSFVCLMNCFPVDLKFFGKSMFRNDPHARLRAETGNLFPECLCDLLLQRYHGTIVKKDFRMKTVFHSLSNYCTLQYTIIENKSQVMNKKFSQNHKRSAQKPFFLNQLRNKKNLSFLPLLRERRGLEQKCQKRTSVRVPVMTSVISALPFCSEPLRGSVKE